MVSGRLARLVLFLFLPHAHCFGTLKLPQAVVQLSVCVCVCVCLFVCVCLCLCVCVACVRVRVCSRYCMHVVYFELS
jgi:hypothetical protein